MCRKSVLFNSTTPYSCFPGIDQMWLLRCGWDVVVHFNVLSRERGSYKDRKPYHKK